jgi:hypothetical protein
MPGDKTSANQRSTADRRTCRHRAWLVRVASWRRRPELNRGWRFCRPLPYRLATAPLGRDRPVVGWSETGRATCGDSVEWSWSEVGVPTVALGRCATQPASAAHAASERQPSPAIESKGWSGKRDSNPRLRPWQGRTLPLSYSRPARHAKCRIHIVIQAEQPVQA